MSRPLLLFSLVLGMSTVAAAEPNITTRGFSRKPAISADRIAFIYANDLWTCDLEGKNVRRLTSDVGVELSPAFSPEGKWIAFSAKYEGNADVYVVGSEGGVPKRRRAETGRDRAPAGRVEAKRPLPTPLPAWRGEGGVRGDVRTIAQTDANLESAPGRFEELPHAVLSLAERRISLM